MSHEGGFFHLHHLFIPGTEVYRTVFLDGVNPLLLYFLLRRELLLLLLFISNLLS